VYLLLLFGLVTSAAAQTGTIVERTIHCASLAGNLVGDSADRPLSLYLPPTYAKAAGRRYPTIYLLHGYQGSYKQWMAGGKEWNIRDVMDKLIRSGRVQEMIIAMPDGNNNYGGSFYCNSVTAGNWEDYLTHDLVTFVDANYRTIRQAASRGIAGHSMGGYGAIRVGMKYPEVFGAVYGLSPACLGWGGDLSLDNPHWDETLSFKTFKDIRNGKNSYIAEAFLALAAAWSPNPDQKSLLVDLPVAGAGKSRHRIDDVAVRWSANMPVAMADQYRSQLARLSGIAFDVGRKDQFSHIPLTCRAFSAALKRNKIGHVFEEYDGDHNDHAAIRIETKLLPFLSMVLRDSAPPR
jgi:S-formylglutathione hydrolase FrmB